ncbi:MAG: hypothetical protein GY754_02700 [bacterium]|nr:hypothetical protein [bacterium]
MKKSLILMVMLFVLSNGAFAAQKALIGHWAFEEGAGTLISDSSDNHNDGEFVGEDIDWIEGVVGNYALNFNSENGYVSIPFHEAYEPDVITIAAWIYSDGVSGAYIRLNNRWHIRYWGGKWDISLELQTGWIARDSGYTIPLQEWHHHAITIDNINRTVTFFVDGEQVGDVQTYETDLYVSGTPGLLSIGQFSEGWEWNGKIDDVKIYDYAHDFSNVNADNIYYVDNNAWKRNSEIYTVEPDEASGKSNLTLLTEIPFRRTHIAATADGNRIYCVENRWRNARLGYYDVNEDTFTIVGNLNIPGLVLASFAPDGTLYIASGHTNKLYAVDIDSAATTCLDSIYVRGWFGRYKRLDLRGADIAFSSDNTLYVMTRKHGGKIYSVDMNDSSYRLKGSYFAKADHFASGLAVLDQGDGNLVYSSALNHMIIIDRSTGQKTAHLPVYLDNKLFNTHGGDMAAGCNAQ